MKVVLVNGSPNQKGCTFTALEEIAKTLNSDGIETEVFHIGAKAISGCMACYKCREIGHCVFSDTVNEFVELAQSADGFIFGSPVHYAAAGGAITSFMDRAFFSEVGSGKRAFYLKPAAAIVSARRAGTTAALDQMNKYFAISQMPIIPSQYWNMVHGTTPDEVKQDLEGLQIMRTLAKNMAWFLKCKEAGIAAGIKFPEREAPARTNFIR